MSLSVAVLGASQNPDRHSHRAVVMLLERGYRVLPIHPSGKDVAGVECHRSLRDVPQPVDTITVYLSAANSTQVIDDILAARPRRVILNPGAENPELARRCRESGIEVQEACTLVQLRTGQF